MHICLSKPDPSYRAHMMDSYSQHFLACGLMQHIKHEPMTNKVIILNKTTWYLTEPVMWGLHTCSSCHTGHLTTSYKILTPSCTALLVDCSSFDPAVMIFDWHDNGIEKAKSKWCVHIKCYLWDSVPVVQRVLLSYAKHELLFLCISPVTSKLTFLEW